ncbi:hypothetical protein DCMF_16120 [Candidatus Formimonas warabiya]|uniref:AEC family transporter n=2 Tax=Formimonas warabiya TaxID=1761012 RepID=A0A3G1KV66_FORW1|nr:hypothetical protein DCMF_16120 [Candidatus Formimonas warabiya]
MLKVLMQILVLFLLIGVGYFCKKTRLISNHMNQDVGNLLVYVSLPAIIIVSLNGLSLSGKLLAESGQLLLISLCTYLIFILLSYPLVKVLKVKGTTRDIFQFGLVFGNTSFMGFPVAYAIFGEPGIFFMAVFDVSFALFVWTFGVMVVCRPAQEAATNHAVSSWLPMLKQIVNPSIIAVAIGFLLLVTSTKLPGPVHQSLQLLGSLTTPLSMIFIGSALGDIEVRVIFRDLKVLLCSLERLLFLPLIIFGLLKLFHFTGYLMNIPVLYAAMPVAAITSILSAKYGNDYHLASRFIFVSTLLSMVTIPCIVWVLLR